MIKIYCARWVLPISSPVIEDGAVAVQNELIVGVGARAEILSGFPEASLVECGNAAILPGLINAHSHLELTVMRGFLECEEGNFFAWLRKLTKARMALTGEDLRVSAVCGAVEAARAGITCVADSSSLATKTMTALREIGLRAVVYQESFGPDPDFVNENMDGLKRQLELMREMESDLVRAGVSPHAPYTVSPIQLKRISRLAFDEKLPLMMHAAESLAEKQLIERGEGPFAEGLKKRGIEWQASRVSTIEHLRRHGVMETKPLLAHCINVDEDDLETINQSGARIAHCPKSNAKLGHGRAPFAKFLAHEINVGLGSDSVASNNTCDILEEARFAALLARLNSGVSAEQALFAATLGGARALGLDDQIGALTKGMQADIAIVNLDGAYQQPAGNPIDTLVFSSSGKDVQRTIVAGNEVYRCGHTNKETETNNRKRLQEIRNRLNVAVIDRGVANSFDSR